MPKKPLTPAEYIAAAPKEGRKHLRAMRALLKKASPKAKESLKWAAIAYEETRILYMFAGFRAHLTFAPTPAVIRQFRRELAKFTTGKGSIQFPYDKPLPKSLITRMARARIKALRENDARWM